MFAIKGTLKIESRSLGTQSNLFFLRMYNKKRCKIPQKHTEGQTSISLISYAQANFLIKCTVTVLFELQSNLKKTTTTSESYKHTFNLDLSP